MQIVPKNARILRLRKGKKAKFPFDQMPVQEDWHFVGPDVVQRFKKAWWMWGQRRMPDARYSIKRSTVGVLITRERDWDGTDRPGRPTCTRDTRVFRDMPLEGIRPGETIAITDTRFLLWASPRGGRDKLMPGERDKETDALVRRAKYTIASFRKRCRREGRDPDAFVFLVEALPDAFLPTVLIYREPAEAEPLDLPASVIDDPLS